MQTTLGLNLSNRRYFCKPFIGTSSAARVIPRTMVEGHQCHRVAHFHRETMVGKCFKATSPNGRFVDGAKAINGKPLKRFV